ncbi:MAG: DUF2064 domain-containing protein [Gammaproteobacteria bacterium]|nr:DUF2064 domain-containing protein [Gammaproteobacteria bacterium]
MPHTPADAITLVVFCRRPTPGSGKRRLARDLGETTTLLISELLLATALEDAAAWPGHRIIATAEPVDEGWARSLPLDPDNVVLQPDGNLGERLMGVDRLLRSQGHTRLLYIGSDAPILSSADYQAARAGLVTHDVVLGPALDGGVTYLGSRRPWPTLTDLPWSSERLHDALQAICERSGMSVQNLELRYDIDVQADLGRLCADLSADTRPARRALYQALRSLGY